MSLTVLTVVTDGDVWESALVAALKSGSHGVTVVRRCVGAADLLAVASTGVARAAVLPADLPLLDRSMLTRLAASGVAVVGLAGSDDPAAQGRLRAMGVTHVLSTAAPAGAVAVALRAAVAVLTTSAAEPSGAAVSADPRPSGVGKAAREAGARNDPAAAQQSPISGRVIAVWGPTGAPGRTTVAIGLADEAARLGVPTLLVDADTFGGVVGQMLGLLDEAPGLAAAARLAGSGRLDVGPLAALARSIGPTFRVLTGIGRAERWPEISAEAMAGVLDVARHLVALTVVDCGFCLEQDEELVYDTVAPRRNGATLATISAADVVLAVGAADPVGVQRLIRGLAALREAVPAAEPQVVVNRLRKGVVPGDPEREVATALQRFAGVAGVWTLPYDRPAADRALAEGRTLAEVVEGAPLQRALAELAAHLTGIRRRPRPRRAPDQRPAAPPTSAWPVRASAPSRGARPMWQ